MADSDWIVETVLKKRRVKVSFHFFPVSCFLSLSIFALDFVIQKSSEYLVKWKGYDDEYNSWVAEEELEEFAYEEMADFENRVQAEKNAAANKILQEKKRKEEQEKKEKERKAEEANAQLRAACFLSLLSYFEIPSMFFFPFQLFSVFSQFFFFEIPCCFF